MAAYRCRFRRTATAGWEVYRTSYPTKAAADDAAAWLKSNGWWRDLTGRLFPAGSVHSTRTEKE